ncbi:DUF1304 domain-containing protein [Octadecabacter sp.]|nr:DUF1304 domain-containing protein [Octadecabacter sp.]
MHILAKVLISLIAALHLYIAWFEIFAWTTREPVVFFTFPADLFERLITLAANQGIYNAFLAAGLIWSLFIRDARWHTNVATCFLFFVFVAGVFGAITISPRIAIVQSVTALIALITLWVGQRRA